MRTKNISYQANRATRRHMAKMERRQRKLPKFILPPLLATPQRSWGMRLLFTVLSFAAAIASAGALAGAMTLMPALSSSLPTRLPQSSGTGGTYFVDPSNSTGGASDANTATQAQTRTTPWLTMAHAASTVPISPTGAIVVVIGSGITVNSSSLAGVFNFTRAGSITDPVTIKTETNYGVTISGTSTSGGAQVRGFLIGNGTSTRATGLRIQGFVVSVTGNNSEGINVNAGKNVEIYDCKFTGNGGQAGLIRGYGGGQSDNVWYYRCEFWNNGIQTSGAGFTGTVATTHSMYIGQPGDAETNNSGSINCVVASCVFHAPLSPGYHLQIGSQFKNGFIVNNTFIGGSYVNVTATGSSFAGNGIIGYANNATNGTAGNVIANNIFYKLPGISAGASGTGVTIAMGTITNNLTYQNQHLDSDYSSSTDYATTWGGRTYWTVTGNLPNADPLFFDVTNLNSPTTLDLRIHAGSPAASLALPQYAPGEDYAGNARSATTPSVGAYEVDTAGSATTVGKTGIGASTTVGLVQDFNTASLANLANTLTVNRIRWYLSGGASAQKCKAMIYADTGTGSPGALVATSGEVTIAAGQAAGWVDFTIPSTNLAIGNYWIALIRGTVTAQITAYYDGGGTTRYVADVYSDGPANPFASGAGTQLVTYSAYADFNSPTLLLKDVPMDTPYPDPVGGTLGTVNENVLYGSTGVTLKNTPLNTPWPPT